jgi:hypothetical protein
MSVSVSVFFKAASQPTPIAWQATIREAGFELELDTDFDPQTFRGFLPGTYRGLPAGFEFYLDQIDGAGGAGSERRAAAAVGHDRCVTLVTHASMAEGISASLAAASLAVVTNGVLFDDESDEAHPPSEALVWARGIEREGAPYLEAR